MPGKLIKPFIFLLLIIGWPHHGGPLPHHIDYSTTSASEELPDLAIIPDSLVCYKIVVDSVLYTEGWDTLRKPKFWQMTMHFPPESTLVNIAKTREVVDVLDTQWLANQRRRWKRNYQDSVKNSLGMDRREELFFTTGRNHFYQIRKVIPQIDQAIKYFRAEGVDPWYAQAILLIESPARLQYSTDGAYGPFQLMPRVARSMGLKVNNNVDERADLEKSAKATAKFIKLVVLPHTREICQKVGVPVEENALWFRLLNMHVYHAGHRNVYRVMRKIRPKAGGQQLITKIWETKSRRFGNASQNYSQIVLACIMELNELMNHEGIFCPVKEPET